MDSGKNRVYRTSYYELCYSLNTQSSQKQKKCLQTKKILEEYNVKIYENDPYLFKNYKEKIKADKSRHDYIQFRIDV